VDAGPIRADAGLVFVDMKKNKNLNIYFLLLLFFRPCGRMSASMRRTDASPVRADEENKIK
jgi:hypothetical protein